jgi:hypothetical protein
VSLADAPANVKPVVLLGSTLNFLFLLDRADGSVSIHPYDNVLAIQSSVPSADDD